MASKLNSRWYANLNDLIGGYAIGTKSGPCSSGRLTDDVADMLDEPTARYIVMLHNLDIILTDRARAR
jgi:hypothetical protein